MNRTPPPRDPTAQDAPEPPSGKSGLPNLDDGDDEATATRQTETGLRTLPSVPPRINPTLTVLTGVDAGRVIKLDAKENFIGRAMDCRLVLSDPGVSRKHAKITVRGATFTVADLESKNGTYVDGVQAKAVVSLEPNQVVQIGPNVSVRFALMTETEEKLARDLYESSMRDPLTRAFNRRYFSNRLNSELTYAGRHKTVLSVISLDLDHFKKLNDTFGHAAGDAVLKHVVACIGTTLRGEDVLARVGGEEFAVLLRGIVHPNAFTCADRVRRAVASAPFSYEGKTIAPTISLGVADTVECGALVAAKLLKLADERLYKAKAAGRNRVCGGEPVDGSA